MMLSFKPYLPGDKDFGYLAQDEDSCKDLIEQYLNQDTVDFGDPIESSDGFQAFDFAFDEETESSESCSADSNNHRGSKPELHPSPPTFHSEPVPVPVQLPLRTRPNLVPGAVPGRKAARCELPELRGRSVISEYHSRAPSPKSSSAAAPTLRRKGKFCAPAHDTLRGRAQEIEKTTSAEMIRPACRQEMPSFNDWNRSFEQFSLQTPVTSVQTSPSRNSKTYRDKRPTRLLNTFAHPQAQLQNDIPSQPRRAPATHISHYVGASTAPLPHDWMNQGSIPASPVTAVGYDYGCKPSFERPHIQHLRHPSIGEYGPLSPLTPECSNTVGQVQPSWLHSLPETNLNPYFENNPPIQRAAPPTPDTVADFTSPGIGFYDPFNSFVNEDPSHDYNVHSQDNYYAPSTNVHENITEGDVSNHTRSLTPPPRSLSVSPPLHSPTKSRLRSKSHRSQKSISNLKSPKSNGALKSKKSSKDLRSAKSMGTFGFVNFTEADKGRILTGVAPSGSSKTKARRELEAADKKRRLSQAALRAVEEAGGDVEVLRRVEEFDC